MTLFVSNILLSIKKNGKTSSLNQVIIKDKHECSHEATLENYIDVVHKRAEAQRKECAHLVGSSSFTSMGW